MCIHNGPALHEGGATPRPANMTNPEQNKITHAEFWWFIAGIAALGMVVGQVPDILLCVDHPLEIPLLTCLCGFVVAIFCLNRTRR